MNHSNVLFILKHFTQNTEEMGDMIRGQKKSEIVLYVVLWAILFAAAALSVYWDGQEPLPGEVLPGVSSKSSSYDWMGLWGTWKLLAIFCLFFFIHNFLIAPLLVYRNKKWQYGICTCLLMAVFVWSNMQRQADVPQPKEKPMAPLQKELDFLRRVGLQNAIKRLKLIYGHDYELKIDANADEHRLLLRLPFK